MNKDYEKRIDELEKIVKSLSSSTTIPLNVDGAFRKRLGIDSLSKVKLNTSTKSTTSEIITIDEAGSSIKYAQGIPDGYTQTTLSDGTIIYIPYYV